jgi:hypothetical protein
MFKVREKPFGRYPRSLQEAFKGVDYGCAISTPTPTKKWLVHALEAFPKVVWAAGVIALVLILINIF